MDSRQRERCDSMIIQPEWGTRNVNKLKSYGSGSKAAGTAAPSVGRKPSESAKAAFDGRNGCQKCFCVTFGESNKAYAPYPALITRTGRKDID